MKDVLDIAEVVRRTGLTSRTLRFYEARGLLRPLRTHKSRRLYGAAELARIGQIVALKRAGLTLAQIADLLARGAPDLGQLVAGQLAALAERQARIAETRGLLLAVQARLARGEAVDVETLCQLIRQGDEAMNDDAWAKVAARYVSPGASADWVTRPLPDGLDQAVYLGRWRDLGGRIEAALPLAPDSRKAQGFVTEWFALLKPLTANATPAMMHDVTRMYDDDAFWDSGVDPGFSRAVWDFIKLASATRLEGASV